MIFGGVGQSLPQFVNEITKLQVFEILEGYVLGKIAMVPVVAITVIKYLWSKSLLEDLDDQLTWC